MGLQNRTYYGNNYCKYMFAVCLQGHHNNGRQTTIAACDVSGKGKEKVFRHVHTIFLGVAKP